MPQVLKKYLLDLQVLPGELARLIRNTFRDNPNYVVDTCLARNDPICLRTTVFFQWSRLMANLLVILIRNIKFYLYIPLNRHVRVETINVCLSCCRKLHISEFDVWYLV